MIVVEILLIWRKKSRHSELLFVVFVLSYTIVLVFFVKLDIEFKLWVFNSTFNNMTLISWRSVLLIEYSEKTNNLPQVSDKS